MLGKWAASKGLSRFVALVHTEGCGLSSSGATEQMHLRTMMGYVAHPLARRVLLLEHGCEKTHNDYMRNGLEEWGLDPAVFGWASVQLDGGIVKAMDKVEAWFHQALAETEAPMSPWNAAWVPCAWGCRRPVSWGRTRRNLLPS